MTVPNDITGLKEVFKTADTADKLRSVTTEQIRAAFSDEPMTTVRAENIRSQLLRAAQVQEVAELKQSFLELLGDKLAVKYPDVVIEAKRENKRPCVLIWPKGKADEGDGDE